MRSSRVAVLVLVCAGEGVNELICSVEGDCWGAVSAGDGDGVAGGEEGVKNGRYWERSARVREGGA